jgi:hypothetical protein
MSTTLDSASPARAGKKQAVSSQFQPGKSGNPRGRTKGSHNDHMELMKALGKSLKKHGNVDQIVQDRPFDCLKLYEKGMARYIPRDVQVDVSGHVEILHSLETFHLDYGTLLDRVRAKPKLLEAESVT